MRSYFTLLVFVSFFVPMVWVFSTEGRAENANTKKDYIIDITPDQDPSLLNPAFYNHGVLENDQISRRKEGFFLPNFSIKKIVNSSRSGDLTKGDSLSIESKFIPLGSLKFLGEFKANAPQTNNTENDYALQIGQSIKIDKLKLEAYYRKDNLLANYRSQGFFFNLNYQPLGWASFVASGGSERRNGVNKNSTDININHGQFKTVISPLSFASFVMGINISSQENNNINNDTYTYFVRLNSKWSHYSTFIDYRFQYLDGTADSDTDTLTAGINRIWNKIGAWIKGGLAHKEAMAEEDRYFGALGFNYKPINGFDLQFENRYEKFRSGKNRGDGMRFSGGVNFKLPLTLPFGMECRHSIKLSKVVEGDTNYQFMTAIVIPTL